MDRTLYTDAGASQKRIAHVYLRFTAGTSGAVPSDLTTPPNYSDFISSVVLDTTGVLSVHLQDNYVDLLDWNAGIIQAGDYNAAQASRVVLHEDTDVTSTSDPVVVCNILAEDGTSGIEALANMQTGDIFFLHLTLIH